MRTKPILHALKTAEQARAMLETDRIEVLEIQFGYMCGTHDACNASITCWSPEESQDEGVRERVLEVIAEFGTNPEEIDDYGVDDAEGLIGYCFDW